MEQYKGEYIVELENICKSFPGVKALDNVHFHLKAGEVMALLGENGAGKSTLMKVLSGVHNKDSGTMKIFGQEVDNMTPKRAQELGVAIIHQELNMCQHLTVAENMFLGRERRRGLKLSQKEMNAEAARVLKSLDIELDPTTMVGSLQVSKQQMVEIAKALSTNARILIMDEPTSALTSKEIDELFRIIRRLRAEGKGIVYISHRLEELQHIVDRVTIMRDGHYITEGNFADMDMSYIIANMVGREIKEKFPRVHCEKGKKVLEVKNLNAGRMVRDVSFSSYEGEILGFAGLMGAGRTETTRALFGVDPKESGEIWLDGREIKINNPMDAIRQGVVLAPEDRKKDGLCTKLSVRSNIELPNLDIACNKLGVVNRRKVSEMVKKAISNFSIKLASPESDAGSLSGGNQQKVVVAKVLAAQTDILIFDEPTRGIDVGAKQEIYKLMNNLVESGKSILMISSEMEEMLGMSDRIIVLHEGRVSGEIEQKDFSQEKVLALASGIVEDL